MSKHIVDSRVSQYPFDPFDSADLAGVFASIAEPVDPPAIDVELHFAAEETESRRNAMVDRVFQAYWIE